jgi:hypothetical protein
MTDDTMQVSRTLIARLNLLTDELCEIMALIGDPFAGEPIFPAVQADEMNQQPYEEAVYAE